MIQYKELINSHSLVAVAARLGEAAAGVARAVLTRGLLGETSLGVACACGHGLYKGVRFFPRSGFKEWFREGQSAPQFLYV